MKKVWTIAALAMAFYLLGGSALAQLVGGTSYPINGTENPPTSFQSIQTAVNYLVTNGVTGTGQVIMELSTGYAGETGPVTINNIAGTSATLGVTFRPASGYTAVTSIAGLASPNQFAIRLQGCNYITIDGQSGGGNRDWTISCTGSSYGQSAIRFDNSLGSTSNNTIRYCILQGEATGTTSAIVALTTGTSPNLYQNNIIEYNIIESGATNRGYAVSLGWSSSGLANTGNMIRYNLIRNFADNGIRFTGTFPNTYIYGNEICFTGPVASSATLSGIYFSSTSSNNSGGVYIHSNRIYNLQSTAATTIIGFRQYSGSFTGDPVRFYNNFVSLGYGLAINPTIYGIEDNTSSSNAPDHYYNNSVYIGGTATGGANNSAAFRKALGNTLMNLQNNVLYNNRTNAGGTGTHWAVMFNSTAVGSIGYNDYYADGAGGVLGTTTGAVGGNVATLAAWQAVMTTDVGSVTQDPLYVNSMAAPPDLHINTSRVTQLESTGTPVAVVTDDIDGDARNATTPDIGADEFAGTYGDPTPPAISYTPLTNTLSTSSPRTFDNVDITDADGVNTTAGTRPRCYFKKYGQANAYNDNTSSTDGWKWVEADGSGGSPFTFYLDYTLLYGGTGVASGDTVQYFVVAQDLSPYTNVAINQGTFATYPASVSLTAAAFPIGGTTRSYLILQAPMHGDYTVGLTKFNQAAGLNVTVTTETRRVTKEVRYLETETAKTAKAADALSEWKTKLVEVHEQHQVLLEKGKPYTGPLCVEAKDGTKGVYATLTAAVNDMNARGIDGAIRFLLNDASYTTETLPIVINSVAGASASNTITIQPNTGVTAAISGASAAGPVIKVFNTNYVTIDGSNAGGVDRNLTITNTSTTSPNVVWMGNAGTTPLTNATLKNCLLVNGANTSSAVVIGGGTAVGDSGYFNTVTLENCAIQNAYIGSYARGYNGVETASMLVYLNNDLSTSGAGAIRYIGLYCQGVNSVVIQGNTIGNFNGASTEDDKGIWMATATKNAMCHENRIYNLNYTGTGGYGAHGIYVSSSTSACNDAVYNNLIYNLSGDGWNYTSIPTDNTIGIVVSGTQDGVGLYYNSINLYGNTLNQTNSMSMGILLNAGSVADIRDNNIVNNLGLAAATGYGSCGVYAVTANTQFADINYNDYFVNPSGSGVMAIGKITSANTALTLAEWQALTTHDANSLNADPLYASDSDLRINIGSPSYHAGTPIGSITTDFIGALRDVTTPSIGAYEEAVDLVPPVITYVSPAFGATGVPLNEPIVIAFSEPMDTLSVAGYSDPFHDFTPSWNATSDTFTLVPQEPYAYGVTMSVIVTAGTDLAGNSLPGLPDTAVSFTANQGPNIEMVLQPGDTYDGTGPFLVRAVIIDPSKKNAFGGRQGVASADLYWHIDGAFTLAPGTPGAADTFDFTIPGGIALPGQLISYYLYAEDDQGDGAYNPANAPIGVHQFRILSPLAPTALNATAGDMMVQLDWAPPAQVLDYTNVTSSYYWWPGADAGIIFTTRFTPQHYPCRLEQATSLWFDNVGMDSLLVHVYADDGTGTPDESVELVTPFKILPVSQPTFTVVDLSSYNIVITSGDFHIGYEILTTGMPVPLFDDTPYYLPRSLYKYIDDIWYGDLGVDNMHACAVTYSAYTKGLALKNARVAKGQKPNYSLRNNIPPRLTAVNAKHAPTYSKLTGALALAKNIQQFNVGRSLVSGGPYTTIWSTTGLNCLDTNVQNSTQYYYVVNAQYTMPDTVSAYSNEATATPAAMPILLVDDDCSQVGWPDRQAIYTAALDGAGYSGQYTVYETDGTVNGADGPSAPWYNNRTHVVWWSGGNWEQSNTLTANDETNLAAYLAAGGRLFYSAQDYIWDRYPSAGAFTPGQFPYDYFGLASASQDAITNPYNIAGVAGSLAEGLAYGVIEDPDVGTYADDLTKQSVAGTYDVLDVTAKVGEKTGVAYDNGTFRTVYFTTLFEDITDGTNTKAELMYRILNWLSTGVEGEPAASAKPTVFSLANNYPNPVRTNTTIKFGLPKESQVRVEVYNVAGQRVKTLADGKLNAGYHQITWKGANDNGQKVAAGVYLVRMVTPEFNATRKMTVIR